MGKNESSATVRLIFNGSYVTAALRRHENVVMLMRRRSQESSKEPLSLSLNLQYQSLVAIKGQSEVLGLTLQTKQ